MNSVLAAIIGSSLVLTPPHFGPKPDATVLEVASVRKVYDGDTFTVDLANCDHPILCQNIGVRVLGIDAPELHSRCQKEHLQALEAKAALSQIIQAGGHMRLRNVKRDKYFRIDATVEIDGHDVAKAMKATGLVRDYTGDTRKPWCGL